MKSLGEQESLTVRFTASYMAKIFVSMQLKNCVEVWE